MFIKHIYIHVSPPRTWLRVRSKQSQDTWTIKCNSPYLKENPTVLQTCYLVWAIWLKMPLAESACGWLSHWTEGSPRRWLLFKNKHVGARKKVPSPFLNAPLESPAFLLRGGEIFFPILENDAIRIILDTLVDKVEDVGLRPAVQLGFDFLRISVLCQLLPRFVNKEEEAVLLRVPHLKLLSTELTYILSGDIRSYKEGLSRAATVDFLECNSEIILQVEREKSCTRWEEEMSWSIKWAGWGANERSHLWATLGSGLSGSLMSGNEASKCKERGWSEFGEWEEQLYGQSSCILILCKYEQEVPSALFQSFRVLRKPWLKNLWWRMWTDQTLSFLPSLKNKPNNRREWTRSQQEEIFKICGHKSTYCTHFGLLSMKHKQG